MKGPLLIAEDDPDILALLQLNFELEGYEVLTATDGFEAEALALERRPPVIILDVMMPGRDGLEALRTLKANPETKDLPVVLLTARSTDADIWQGWKDGTDYYMTKPFDIDELVRFIDGLVGG